MFGQELEFVKRRRNWRQDRVYAYDGAGEPVSLPAEWTDVVAPIVLSGTRYHSIYREDGGDYGG